MATPPGRVGGVLEALEDCYLRGEDGFSHRGQD